MPHKCVRCSSVFPNNSPELMRGCSCGSRVFLFLRDQNAPDAQGEKNGIRQPAPQAQQPAQAPSPPSAQPAQAPSASQPQQNLPPQSSSQHSDEQDYGWLEDELSFLSKDKPVSVDVDAVENLRILEKGAYEIDLPSLLKGEPLVIKSDKHVYYVKLPKPKS